MFLTQVQQSVTRYLSEHVFFAGSGEVKGIPVIAANDKALATKAAGAMAKLGLCVIVVPLGGDFDNKSASIPYISPGRFTCRVRENQTVNRGASGTGQPGDYVAEVIALLLQHYRPYAIDGTTALGGGGIVLEGIAPGEDEPGLTAWDLIWSYAGGVSHEPVRLDFGADPLP